MHITAICPFCETSYQVQPSLAGQSIRCPNAICRKIFTVAAHLPVSEDSASRIQTTKGNSSPGNGQRSGSVGEMVPILPAEQAIPLTETAEASKHVSDMLPIVPAEQTEPKPADGDWWQAPTVARPTSNPPAAPAAAPPEPTPAEPTPTDAPWWGNAPPVRVPQARTEPPTRGKQPARESLPKTPTKPAKEVVPRPAAETHPMPALPPHPPDQPRELPPGVWEPPPVRRGSESVSEAQTHAPVTADTPSPPVRKRRVWGIILGMAVVVFGVLGGVGAWIYQTVQNSEEVRFAQAKSEYQQRQYGSAASKLHDLAERFPNSEHAEEYRFLQEWCSLCGGLTDADTNLLDAIEKIEPFINSHKKDPLMVQYAADAGQLVVTLAKTFAARNASPTGDKPLAIAQHIEQLRRSVEALGPDALPRAEGVQIDADLRKVRTAVARWRERQEILNELRVAANEGVMVAIKRARILLQRKERESPGFSQDAAVQAAMTHLYAAHLASVVYKRGEEGADFGRQVRQDDEGDSLPFAPLLSTAAPGSAPKGDPIVLALARGVLYALKQSNGELKWATRVGIDTTVLPQRVPASAASPERLLVLSADTQTLTARSTDGDFLWEYSIGQPVLGRPVIIEQRAYLAAYDGSIHEIELSEGKLLGRYPLGQRLTCGGTREGDTKRIYFPADDSCIYVLDVGQQRCVTILYDGHPSGSIRGEPLIIPPEKRAAPDDPATNPSESEAAPGYLILNQRAGLDTMQLRVFELPLPDGHVAPLTLKTPAQLAGWTWFEPKQDGEKLVVLSDAGRLGLFGIRQVGNQDQALFPLLPPEAVENLSRLLSEDNAARERGRSQVVHLRDNDLWVLVHGQLRQVQLRWSNKDGPEAVRGWKEPLALGSPLHAPQRIAGRRGHSTFVLVTQPLDKQTCVASAVDEDGHILWQRQLGLVCQGAPLALKPPQDGPPLFLALDQSGALFSLDPSPSPDHPRSTWENIAPALEDNPRMSPRLLSAADGHSAYEIAAPGKGKSLIVRQVEWDSARRGLRVTKREVSLLPAAGGVPLVPIGTPAFTGSHLLMPLAEGYLARVPLPVPQEQADFDRGGPDWRSPQASPSAPCHVLALGGDRFLTTDGSNGLAVWSWPAGKSYQPLPEGRNRLTYSLPHVVSAPPVLLPMDGQTSRIAVADSAGVLHLLALVADGSLQPKRTWELKGKFSRGPFVRVLPDGGVRLGCVMDQSRLVWVDPNRDKPLWTYRTDGEAIVGQPRMIEDLLVVAHQAGHYVGLDPATGAEQGSGYTLRASAAPAATPLSFGSHQMFTPLSDGTALLLPLKLLREPKP